MEYAKSSTVQAACQRYRNAAYENGEYGRRDDPVTANLYQKEIIRAYREMIQSGGSEGITALLRLTNDADDYVRMWSATHGLQFAPQECEHVLGDLATREGIDGFVATMALQQWQSGELRFPMLTADRFGTLEETRRERESLGIYYGGE